ncbi:hypothetical protein AB1Y20_022519 [Prymnesium parvum]|uniref:Borealin N-terminal domain-containing protein n=1 Tax=Prymnesium parvum TaxID=97485 RepID=A0AB34JHT6_PRYPA
MPLAALSATSVSFHEDLRAAREADLGNPQNDAFFQELEFEIAERVNQMHALAERLAARLEKKFQCEVLLKMPKDIRSMKMKDFCLEYGGDVDEALKQQVVPCAVLLKLPPKHPSVVAQLEERRVHLLPKHQEWHRNDPALQCLSHHAFTKLLGWPEGMKSYCRQTAPRSMSWTQ